MFQLASASPRRIELLRRLGVDVTVVPAAVDEERYASPASAKADSVARDGVVTLAVDTEVELDGVRLGKPRDHEHALELLRRLAGREHEVRSEVVVVSAAGTRLRFGVRTRVRVTSDDSQLVAYAATDEPLDKAGAYAIQGDGRRIVEGFEGCFANVTGLPLCHVYFALRRSGVASRERPEVACQSHFAFRCPVWQLAQRQGRTLSAGREYASWSDDLSGDLGVRR
ncbi:MAG TPA: Maf family protein [Candidatus Limnocylindria bacterium]